MKKQIMKSLIIKLSKENSLVTQFTSFVAVEKRDDNESPFPSILNVLELIDKEDVDFLPYMKWQEEHGEAYMRQPLSASPGWNEELQPQCLARRKFRSSMLKGSKDTEEVCVRLQVVAEPVALEFQNRDVENLLFFTPDGFFRTKRT